MNRIDLKGHALQWGDMVIWLRKNFGEPQGWGGKVIEPVQLKKSYKWALGEHGTNKASDSFAWPCFWIPDGPEYTMFLLRWL